MAPALVALIPSKAIRSSSSSRSSTPQAKAPCAPPPWMAKFRILTALLAFGYGPDPTVFGARAAPQRERAPIFSELKPRALTALLIAHSPGSPGSAIARHLPTSIGDLPVAGPYRRRSPAEEAVAITFIVATAARGRAMSAYPFQLHCIAQKKNPYCAEPHLLPPAVRRISSQILSFGALNRQSFGSEEQSHAETFGPCCRPSW